jgi:hypothetical protein
LVAVDHRWSAACATFWNPTGRTSVTGPDDFKTKVIGALRRLQKLPHIVRAFFADPDLRYITA